MPTANECRYNAEICLKLADETRARTHKSGSAIAARRMSASAQKATELLRRREMTRCANMRHGGDLHLISAASPQELLDRISSSGTRPDRPERYSLKIDARRALFIGVSFQLVNVTIPKPEQKSHPMLKTDNSRSDIAQWRGNTFDWRTTRDIELGIETGSRVLSGSDAHLSSKRIGDFGHLKCNGVENCLLEGRQNFHRPTISTLSGASNAPHVSV
jgi:hypothetical protein